MHPLYPTYPRSLFFSFFLFISRALLGPLISSGLVFSGDQTQSVAVCAEWGGMKPEVGIPTGAALALAVLCSEVTGEVSRSQFPSVWASVSRCVR